LVLGTIAILLSFSRLVWLVGFIIGIAHFSDFIVNARLSRHGARKFRRRLKPAIPLLFTFLIILFFWRASFLFQLDPLSLSRRLELNRSAFLMIKKNPLLGVGLGNFLVQLPNFWQVNERIRFLQPVHNIFLLVGAETGLIGLAIFIWFLFLTFKKLLKIRNCPPSASRRQGREKLGIPLLIILLTGMADHYWLTLQQSQLMFALILGLTWSKVKK